MSTSAYWFTNLMFDLTKTMLISGATIGLIIVFELDF